MKKIYWRPQRFSLRATIFLAVVSLFSLLLVERFKLNQRQPYGAEKLSSARLAVTAFKIIADARSQGSKEINPITDPARSGLIGVYMSPITTSVGYLKAKRTATNPNFAAVVVDLLKKISVHPGDSVAVGVSGSFPGLNVAAFAALETLKLKPIIISSIGSSQWGANDPNFSWPDMEAALYRKKIFSFRSRAITFGGVQDVALGLSKEAQQIFATIAERSQVPLLSAVDSDDLTNEPSSNISTAIDQRMKFYRDQAGGAEIKAYINIGAGTTSVGKRRGKYAMRPGLSRVLPARAENVDSVMTRFSRQGIPVIHLIKVNDLAERYEFPIGPTVVPAIGQGRVYKQEVYNVWLALGALALVFLTLILLSRSGLDIELKTSKTPSATDGDPDQLL